MPELAHLHSLYEALTALPEGVVGELLNGQLYAHPRPAGPHALVASNLGANLINPFSQGRGGPGGWWIIDEPEIHFVRDAEILVPDVAGWRRERMPSVPEDQRFEVTPDWVCEVLSPSTASKDREVKMPLYARYGVAYAWIIDPREHRLEALALQGGEWKVIGVFGHGHCVCVEPFEAVTLQLDALWS